METAILINEKVDCKDESRRAGTVGRLYTHKCDQDSLRATPLMSVGASAVVNFYGSAQGEINWYLPFNFFELMVSKYQ